MRELTVVFWVVSVKPGIVSCVSEAILQSLSKTYPKCFVISDLQIEKNESHITSTTKHKRVSCLHYFDSEDRVLRQLVADGCTMFLSVIVLISGAPGYAYLSQKRGIFCKINEIIIQLFHVSYFFMLSLLFLNKFVRQSTLFLTT